jgi:hypothetical protein
MLAVHVGDLIEAIRVPIDWHPGLSIYASEPFLRSVGDEYGWIGGVDSSQKLRCILPYTIIKKAFFRMARFRVETILLDDGLDVEMEKSFLNSAIDCLRSLGADMIIPASNNTIFRTYPDGAVAAPYGSFVVDLRPDEEVLWRNVHPKHRNKIRIASKACVEVKTGLDYLERSYELLKETLERSSLGFLRYASFKRLVLGLSDNVELFVAKHDGVVQGCAVVFFSDHAAYYVYGGSIAKPQTGAMNLLHWEIMLHFRKAGVRYYDFVGVRVDPEEESKQHGLMMFKQRFGGRLVKGYMWKYCFNRFKFEFYCHAVRLLRGGDIVDLEHHKLRDMNWGVTQ